MYIMLNKRRAIMTAMFIEAAVKNDYTAGLKLIYRPAQEGEMRVEIERNEEKIKSKFSLYVHTYLCMTEVYRQL